MGGGNVVQAGATLKQADLQKNGVVSAKAIYDLVYNGKGKMPGYGAGCTPKVRCLVLLLLHALQRRGTSLHLRLLHAQHIAMMWQLVWNSMPY